MTLEKEDKRATDMGGVLSQVSLIARHEELQSNVRQALRSSQGGQSDSENEDVAAEALLPDHDYLGDLKGELQDLSTSDLHGRDSLRATSHKDAGAVESEAASSPLNSSGSVLPLFITQRSQLNFTSDLSDLENINERFYMLTCLRYGCMPDPAAIACIRLNMGHLKPSIEYGELHCFALHELLTKTAFRSLTSLSIVNMKIHSNGALWIAALLKATKCLLRLDLSSDGIGPRGVIALSEAIQHSALLSLNLSNNRLYLKGAIALANALLSTPSLVLLNVRNTHLGFEGVRRILEVIERVNRPLIAHLPPKSKVLLSASTWFSLASVGRIIPHSHEHSCNKSRKPSGNSASAPALSTIRARSNRLAAKQPPPAGAGPNNNSDSSASSIAQGADSSTESSSPLAHQQLELPSREEATNVAPESLPCPTLRTKPLQVFIEDNFVWEEILNSLTHGTGLLLAIVFACCCISRSSDKTIFHVMGALVFSFSLILLYTSSCLYHSFFKMLTVKRVFQRLDHFSIYLLIAGTYTPICLISLHGPIGFFLLAVVWSLGLVGIVLDLFFWLKYQTLSTLLYLAMGWSVCFVAKPLMDNNPISHMGVALIAAGGLAYSFGVVFFVLGEKIPIYHSLWHCFVLVGSIFHFAAIFSYILPSELGYHEF